MTSLGTTDTIEESRKLILCFDGTGNSFSGSGSDTNVVKLLRMLDRNDKNQYHYYQTGIGTYDINEKSVNKSLLGEMRSYISQTIDMGFGTTFDAHVMAGYRFLMRYYETGDRIYIFGFSRGAYTAKFLARMVDTVGLLSKGNEEMVPFAYRLYQDHLSNGGDKSVKAEAIKTGEIPNTKKCQHGKTIKTNEINGDYGTFAHPLSPPETPNYASTFSEGMSNDDRRKLKGKRNKKGKKGKIETFSKTFCRREETDCGKDNIKVFFLGMWDCVNSVAVIERAADEPVSVKGTATFVRHAVAVDEFRVKFKPALLAQDIRTSKHGHEDEDIEEVWFPGNHGDVGGGWSAIKDDPFWAKKEAERKSRQEEAARHDSAFGSQISVSTDSGSSSEDDAKSSPKKKKKLGLWQRVKSWVKPPQEEVHDIKEMQLSDIPLAWMIREVELADKEYEKKEGKTGLKWREKRLRKFKQRLLMDDEKRKQALEGFIHDLLRFGYGMGFFKVLMWRFLEYFPLIKRWELDDETGWKLHTFPLNKCGPRDIPRNARLHESLHRRLHYDPNYRPRNNHGNLKEHCLKNPDHFPGTYEADKPGSCIESRFHRTWKFTETPKVLHPSVNAESEQPHCDCS